MANVIPGPGYGPQQGAVETHGTQATVPAGRPTISMALHIVTQDNQPYGSRRRCCEHCGAMCWPGMEGSAQRWTNDWPAWEAVPDNCRAMAVE